jgi:hypothetical protein
MRKSLSILRAAFPPWQDLDAPLIRREIMPPWRTGTGGSWKSIFYLYRVISALVYLFFAFYVLNLVSTGTFEEGFAERRSAEFVFSIFMILLSLALALMNIAGHWQLILVITQTAAGLTSVQRTRSDGDLILMTSIEKLRWHRLQLTALCWQVWPLTKNLMLVGGLLALNLFCITFMQSVFGHESDAARQINCVAEGTFELDVCSQVHISPWVFTAAFLPFGLLFVGLPLLEGPLYASASLFANSRAKHPGPAISYSLASIYAVRVIMMGILVYGGLFTLMLLSGFGKTPNQLLDRDISFGGVFLTGWAMIFVLALGIEWLLYVPPFFLIPENTTEHHLIVYLGFFSIYLLAYVVTSLGITLWLSGMTIRRLERPER